MYLSNTKGTLQGFPVGKEPTCQSRRHNRHRFKPWWGRSPGEENGNPLQYSCLENPMDRGAWWPIIHGVTKSRTQLSAHTHTHTLGPLRKHFSFFLFSNVGHRRGGWINGRLSAERGCVILPCYTQPGKMTSPSNKASSPMIKQSWSLITPLTHMEHFC